LEEDKGLLMVIKLWLLAMNACSLLVKNPLGMLVVVTRMIVFNPKPPNPLAAVMLPVGSGSVN
jgi:hypothetical protein